MSKLAETALGGNALLRENERGTIEEQEKNAMEAIENLIFLIRDGYDLVITHANGPQVSNILMRNDAVIDKDMASSLLATQIGADELYILTDVPFIYKDFGKSTQEKLEFLDYADTLKYLHAGVFGEGSMAPKIRACLRFIENGGQKSVITEAKKLEDKRYGSKTTMNYE